MVREASQGIFSKERESRELVEHMRRKVKMAQAFLEPVFSFPKDADPKIELEKAWEASLRWVPEKQVDVVRNYAKALEKRTDLEQVFVSIQNMAKKERLELLKLLVEKEIAAMSEIEKTRGDIPEELSEYAQLAYALHRLRHILIAKHAQVLRLAQKDPETIANIINMAINSEGKLAGEDIKEMLDDDPFSNTILVRAEGYKRIKPDSSRGFYVTDTPLCIVNSDSPNVKDTIRHERIHNLTHDLIPVPSPEDTFRIDLDSAQREIQAHNPIDLSRAFSSEKYLNELHGEIVAAIEAMVENKFRLEGMLEKEVLLAIMGKSLNPLTRYTQASYTAGRDIHALLSAVRQESKNHDLPEEIRTRLAVVAMELGKGFVHIMQAAEKAFKNVESLPKALQSQAKEELFLLTCLLKPNKYRHLPTYMRYTYVRSRPPLKNESGPN